MSYPHYGQGDPYNAYGQPGGQGQQSPQPRFFADEQGNTYRQDPDGNLGIQGPDGHYYAVDASQFVSTQPGPNQANPNYAQQQYYTSTPQQPPSQPGYVDHDHTPNKPNKRRGRVRRRLGVTGLLLGLVVIGVDAGYVGYSQASVSAAARDPILKDAVEPFVLAKDLVKRVHDGSSGDNPKSQPSERPSPSNSPDNDPSNEPSDEPSDTSPTPTPSTSPSDSTPSPSPSASSTPNTLQLTGDKNGDGLLFGATGTGVADGSYTKWFGAPLEIVTGSTTALGPAGEFKSWNGNYDTAITSIDRTKGETWDTALTPAYDTARRQELRDLRTTWATRTGTPFLRWASGFNAAGSKNEVKPGEEAKFKAAFQAEVKRAQEEFPEAVIVWAPLSKSTNGLITTAAYPGKDFTKLILMYDYNERNFSATTAQTLTDMSETSTSGEPYGIKQWSRFARENDTPLAIIWGSRGVSDATSKGGDAPEWITTYLTWVRQNAGNGPGQIAYTIQNNTGNYTLFPATASKQPKAAAAMLAVMKKPQ